MSSIVRNPAIVDASASNETPKVTVDTQPARGERFTAERVQDPETLAAQLTRINQLALDATNEGRTDPLRGVTIYRGLEVGIGGTKLIIRHGRGRRVSWWPVGWSGAATTTSPDLVCDDKDLTNVVTDEDTLALKSYVIGTLDLAVA